MLLPQVARYVYKSPSRAVGAMSAHRSLRRHVSSQHRSSGLRGALSRHSHTLPPFISPSHPRTFAFPSGLRTRLAAWISELTLELNSVELPSSLPTTVRCLLCFLFFFPLPPFPSIRVQSQKSRPLAGIPLDA